MKKFTRQTSGNAPTADVNLDFAAAGAKVARLFEPGEYRLRIDSARIIQNNQNVSVVLNLIEMESGSRVDIRPLWVDGPNAGAGDLAVRNRDLIAQLLTLSELRSWRGWSSMRASYSTPTVAPAEPTTRSLTYIRMMGHDGPTIHIRRGRAAAG